nr:MAG TPA: hypothetical protein [Caudoviricetes sp.]
MALGCQLQSVLCQLLHGIGVVPQGIHSLPGIDQPLGFLLCGYLRIHPLHHPGGRRCGIAYRLMVLALFGLCTALLPVHGLGGSGGIALFLGSKGIAQLFENIIHRGHVVFIQTQTGGCARTEDRVDTVHRNAGLCTHVVAQTDAAAMEAFGLGCIPGLHLLLRVLKTVKIVGVQHREIEILSTNNHVLAPFVGPCAGFAPASFTVSRHKRSPFRVWSGDCV